jgi:hypothetical protein
MGLHVVRALYHRMLGQGYVGCFVLRGSHLRAGQGRAGMRRGSVRRIGDVNDDGDGDARNVKFP